MPRVILFPFSMSSSKSDARIQERIEELRPDLDCIRVYPDRNYRPTAGDLIVDWGAGNRPNWADRIGRGITYLNPPDAVARCVSKTASFAAFRDNGVRCVPFTTSRTQAAEWALNGHRVLARELTEARDGEGAVVLNTVEEVRASRAGLYTLFIPKRSEFRVHVWRGTVIGTQKRVRRDDEEITNHLIRTSSNGWGLTRNWSIELDHALLDNAVAAVHSLGLDFGAVDVGVDYFDRDFVFEVNSAPEVLGPGVDIYARAILSHVE